MFKSACDAVKKSVILVAFFFALGATLEIVAQFLTLEGVIPVYFAYMGIIAIFVGLIILVATLIAVMIPKVNQHLQACQH